MAHTDRVALVASSLTLTVIGRPGGHSAVFLLHSLVLSVAPSFSQLREHDEYPILSISSKKTVAREPEARAERGSGLAPAGTKVPCKRGVSNGAVQN